MTSKFQKIEMKLERPDLGEDTSEYEDEGEDNEESEGESPQSPQMEESGQKVEHETNAGSTFEEDLEVKIAKDKKARADAANNAGITIGQNSIVLGTEELDNWSFSDWTDVA